MATIGNLELRFNESSWYASTTHDGNKVYEAVPRLVDFLDSVKNPTREQFGEWFNSTSRELLPANYRERLLGGVPHEVIMDFPRKLILHNGYKDAYEAVSKDFPTKLENAHILLREKYNFEILEFTNPKSRKERAPSFSPE